MTETEKLEVIQDLGRAAANSLMTSAVEEADNVDQADNQMLATYWAGVHLAAHHIFNSVKLEGKRADDMFRAVNADIQDEFDSLLQSEKDGEMEVIKYPGGEQH